MRRIAPIAARPLLLAVLALAAAAGALRDAGDAQAKLLIRTLVSPNLLGDGGGSANTFAFSLAMGDVNGDNKADIIAGAREDVNPELGNYDFDGFVYVISGANGAVIRSLTAPGPALVGSFGSAVATGDVDGDNTPDIAVGAPLENFVGTNNGGSAHVFSGATGNLIFTLNTPNPVNGGNFGESIAVGNVDGDARGDIVVGAPSESGNAGQVHIFSGLTGNVIRTLASPNPQPSGDFGREVATGYVDGDGRSDIAVSAPYEVAGSGQGRVHVLSGADGTLIFSLDTPNPAGSGQFGDALAVADIDGDNRAEVAVGDQLETVGQNGAQGRAYIYSGATGGLLRTLNSLYAQGGGRFGASLALGDVWGDDTTDILVGATGEDAGPNGPGRVYIFLGLNGPLLDVYLNPVLPGIYHSAFGIPLALGNVSGNSRLEIAVGSPSIIQGGAGAVGRAHIFAFTCRFDLDNSTGVGFGDLLLLAKAYGSNINSPNWNPMADFGGSGYVDFSDLLTLAMHYGENPCLPTL